MLNTFIKYNFYLCMWNVWPRRKDYPISEMAFLFHPYRWQHNKPACGAHSILPCPSLSAILHAHSASLVTASPCPSMSVSSISDSQISLSAHHLCHFFVALTSTHLSSCFQTVTLLHPYLRLSSTEFDDDMELNSNQHHPRSFAF